LLEDAQTLLPPTITTQRQPLLLNSIVKDAPEFEVCSRMLMRMPNFAPVGTTPTVAPQLSGTPNFASQWSSDAPEFEVCTRMPLTITPPLSRMPNFAPQLSRTPLYSMVCTRTPTIASQSFSDAPIFEVGTSSPTIAHPLLRMANFAAPSSSTTALPKATTKSPFAIWHQVPVTRNLYMGELLVLTSSYLFEWNTINAIISI
jgi:hypothetical protein